MTIREVIDLLTMIFEEIMAFLAPLFEKKYEEEEKQLQRDIILSKPLETYGNQEVEDLKNKYDNM